MDAVLKTGMIRYTAFLPIVKTMSDSLMSIYIYKILQEMSLDLLFANNTELSCNL